MRGRPQTTQTAPEGRLLGTDPEYPEVTGSAVVLGGHWKVGGRLGDDGFQDRLVRWFADAVFVGGPEPPVADAFDFAGWHAGPAHVGA